ncbi:MAG: acyl-CoA dehydratase activase [Pseudomonadota bacterium]
MQESGNVMGIDVGSTAAVIVEIDPNGKVVGSAYEFHSGDPAGALTGMLARFDLSRIRGVAATTSTPDLARVDRKYDNRVCLIRAVKEYFPAAGTILLVGGEKFGAVFFDDQGAYANYKGNTSCAAGTGGFLDQQARRLKLSGIEEFSRMAFGHQGAVPRIASRCAVFAKTDLIHAQQEGYSLEAVCDGLCEGMARNVYDTLFSGRAPLHPVVFSGGAAKNRAVVRRLENMIGGKLLVDEDAVCQAAGAALCLRDESTAELSSFSSPEDIIRPQGKSGLNYYGPLNLTLSDYPEFTSLARYDFLSRRPDSNQVVEVDLYEKPAGGRIRVVLGLDIGSTSTKAALVSLDEKVLAGFYTRTAGRPVTAVQLLLEAITDAVGRMGTELEIVGATSTGSGRKLAGRVVGADLILDEITAHARAACKLNPEVDTIIEIGGQDSKFTTLRRQSVTFSVMNNVCAAGTGSFIEEQAERFGCPLSEYSGRTEGRTSPLASDRCTVFMERDLNYYLREGFAKDEVLAAVLHSIRENYLTKVAVEKSIGRNVVFQGATAKNRALVAAFEQRLGRPIHVSKFCHLTGAIGGALVLLDRALAPTRFRGLELYEKEIPVRSEVCGFCANHCKITAAEVDGETLAFGFLCGRDYEDKKRVGANRTGFDLVEEWNKTFSLKKKRKLAWRPTIGLPRGLYLHEDLGFWEVFFDSLSLNTLSSAGFDDPVKTGKRIAGAEFCAPMAAFHGHVNYLLDKTDYVFLPVYLERKTEDKKVRRQYCYYSQYSPALASLAGGPAEGNRILRPLARYLYQPFFTKIQLLNALNSIPGLNFKFQEIRAALARAEAFQAERQKTWRETYARESRPRPNEGPGFHVVLLGRPYTVFSRSMNKGVPDLFAGFGVRTFFQDMLTIARTEVERIRPMLDQVHWHYAAHILEAAEKTAQTPGAYPVMITSFKCTPDSFAIEYFKEIMEAHDKPYLVLQLDDHDSNVGYETRIEAAIRSFDNHYRSAARKANPSPSPNILMVKSNRLADKTLFLPNWDDISLPLVAANIRREGLDARLLEQSETSMRKGLRRNTGQCIPLNIVAQEFIDGVEKQGLDPARAVLWMISSTLSCNLGLFGRHIKTLLNDYGRGFEQAGVYTGDISFFDISAKLPLNTYFAFLFGGRLRKIGCRLRPYELEKGRTDRVIRESLASFEEAFLGKKSKEAAAREAVRNFLEIPVAKERTRPKAAIFGDLYVRDNEVMNQDLVHFIEEHGGEVVTTPYTMFLKMIARAYSRKWLIEGNYFEAISSGAMLAAFRRLERTYDRIFAQVLADEEPAFNASTRRVLAEYDVRLENTGESMENLMKIHYLLKEHPDLALLVQTSPAFCCPSLVTEAMAREIEKKTGVPIVSLTYDGSGGSKNEAVIPYLKFSRKVRS